MADAGEGDRNDQERIYVVVVNAEEQYSIWPADREVPEGWAEAGYEGSRDACLQHVDRVWLNMTPRSARRR